MIDKIIDEIVEGKMTNARELIESVLSNESLWLVAEKAREELDRLLRLAKATSSIRLGQEQSPEGIKVWQDVKVAGERYEATLEEFLRSLDSHK
jgi:hypothetical protein